MLTYSFTYVPASRPSKCLSVATLRPGWGIKKQATQLKQEWICLRTSCSCSYWESVTYIINSKHNINFKSKNWYCNITKHIHTYINIILSGCSYCRELINTNTQPHHIKINTFYIWYQDLNPSALADQRSCQGEKLYCITGNFGEEKVWWIWQIIYDLPN